MSFFRRLRAARLFLRCQPYIDLPNDVWTSEDRAAWLHFRGSPAGRKLGVILSNQVARSAVIATAAQHDIAHACGYACGIRGTVAVLDSLLPEQISPAGAQPGNPEGSASEDAADPFAHLAP